MGVRVAIAHDYLTQRGGAERVVLSMLKAFPDADLHTTLFDPVSTFPEFSSAVVHTSWLNKVGVLRRHHRWALPLLPLATSSMRIDADVVLASSSGWAHGVRVTGRKLVYCHTPARWLYAEADYLHPGRTGPKRWALTVLRGWLRTWDRNAARTVDLYLANSRVSQRRIRTAYGIAATVVHPPHAMGNSLPVEPMALPAGWGSDPAFLLTVSRLMPYKNVASVINAAAATGRRLVVVGRGPDKARLQAMADDQVLFCEDVADPQLRWLYSSAEALVAASSEDLGLTPIEAAVLGTPTLALRAGGYLETVIEGVNGLFFDEPTADAIADAIGRLGVTPWNAADIVQSAERFSHDRFIEELRRAVDGLMP